MKFEFRLLQKRKRKRERMIYRWITRMKMSRNLGNAVVSFHGFWVKEMRKRKSVDGSYKMMMFLIGNGIFCEPLSVYPVSVALKKLFFFFFDFSGNGRNFCLHIQIPRSWKYLSEK